MPACIRPSPYSVMASVCLFLYLPQPLFVYLPIPFWPFSVCLPIPFNLSLPPYSIPASLWFPIPFWFLSLYSILASLSVSLFRSKPYFWCNETQLVRLFHPLKLVQIWCIIFIIDEFLVQHILKCYSDVSPFEECQSKPCYNGADCSVDWYGSYICDCQAGWRGPQCREGEMCDNIVHLN